MDVQNRIFEKLAVFARRLAYLWTRTDARALSDYMKREMYGMDIREQEVVRDVLAMAGQVIRVRRDTVAINKKLELCLLQEGDQIRLSKSPILLDHERNLYIALLDRRYNVLAIKLSDYITDIHSGDRT